MFDNSGIIYKVSVFYTMLNHNVDISISSRKAKAYVN